MAFKGIIYQSKTRKDDIAAFEKLFRTYYSDLVNYSFGYTRDMDASEEIVQEFFYNYWKNRKETNIKFSIRAYLFRAIKNNTLNYLDSLAVRKKYADRVLFLSENQPFYEEEGMEMDELNELIEETLDSLPERCSTIFRMSRHDGLKYDEIAAKLSVSVKTVEANMGKALKLLRERIGKYRESI
jgi:RNA polymerase sigma-70 factor, ECF subfamily